MKRGFTFIELLAVIIILGTISLIATPLITRQIENSRTTSYRVSVQNTIDAAKEYVSKNMSNNDFPLEGIDVTTLNIKKSNIKSGIIKRNEYGEIEAKNIYDGKYCASGTKNNIIVEKVNSEEECNTIDFTGPELKLKAVKVTDKSIMINAYGYDSQTEIVGYTFKIGNEDEINIESNSNVASYEFTNLKVNQEYEITVKVKNKNSLSNESQYTSNEATHTTEEKIIVKTNELAIPIFTITSNGYSKTKQVTITYPKIENGINSYIYDNEEIIVDGNEITLDITKNGKLKAFTKFNNDEVSNSINIYGIDNNGPAILSVENPDTWEKTKVIKVEVKDTGVGLANKACSFDGGKTWTKYKKVDDKLICTKSFTENQIIDFKVRDKTGNITNIESFLNDKIIINKVDRTPPVCNLKITNDVINYGIWYNKYITVDFESMNDLMKDAYGNTIEGSGIVKSKILDINPTTVEYEMKGEVEDALGNKNTCSIKAKLDNTAPTLTISNPSSTNSGSPTITMDSAYTVSGTVVDQQSSVKYVKVNGQNATINGNNWSYRISSVPTSTLTLKIETSDNVGNSKTEYRYIKRVVKNTSIITWPDTLTGSVSVDTWSGMYSSSVNYGGNRITAPSSVTASGYSNGGYYDNGGKGGILGTGHEHSYTITGRLPANCKKMDFSWWQNGNANMNAGGSVYIYNYNGNVVYSSGARSNVDISAYCDNLHWIKATGYFKGYQNADYSISSNMVLKYY